MMKSRRLDNSCPFCSLQGIVEDAQVLLEGIDGITSVHGGFYDLSSNYYKMQGNHASYYRDALRYLGCVPITDIPGKSGWEHTTHLAQEYKRHIGSLPLFLAFSLV